MKKPNFQCFAARCLFTLARAGRLFLMAARNHPIDTHFCHTSPCLNHAPLRLVGSHLPPFTHLFGPLVCDSLGHLCPGRRWWKTLPATNSTTQLIPQTLATVRSFLRDPSDLDCWYITTDEDCTENAIARANTHVFLM